MVGDGDVQRNVQKRIQRLAQRFNGDGTLYVVATIELAQRLAYDACVCAIQASENL
jgi:hypothetical protein